MLASACKTISLFFFFALFLVSCGGSNESSKDSSYSQESVDDLIRETDDLIRKANEEKTGQDLSDEDIAWRAKNTYGWDCPKVIVRKKITSAGYFFVECSSGKKLRVYPRLGTYPKIKNASGGYN